MEKLLFVINPISGKGKAEKMYYEKIINIFENFDCQIYISQYKNDFNIINHLNIDKIVILGGDGMIHQVTNNLIKHNKDIPIGIIPLGSGNGLFQSIVFYSNKLFNFESSYDIVKSNNQIKLDVMKVVYENNIIYSNLAISWGIISELDINTEKLRCLGNIRFDLGGVWNIIKKPNFYGKLIYLDKNKEIIDTGNFCYFWACNTSHCSYNTCSSPNSLLNDGYIYLNYIKYPISRIKLAKLMLQLSTGTYISDPSVKYIKTKQFSLEIKNGLLVVDGELINSKKINVSLIPRKISILS